MNIILQSMVFQFHNEDFPKGISHASLGEGLVLLPQHDQTGNNIVLIHTSAIIGNDINHNIRSVLLNTQHPTSLWVYIKHSKNIGSSLDTSELSVLQ